MADDGYWALSASSEIALFRLARSDKAYESLDIVVAQLEEQKKMLAAIDRPEFFLMLDLRAAPVRNDPEYEKVVASFRQKALEAWRGVVIVVATEMGARQLRRHARQDGASYVVFTNEVAAITYVRGKLKP